MFCLKTIAAVRTVAYCPVPLNHLTLILIINNSTEGFIQLIFQQVGITPDPVATI